MEQQTSNAKQNLKEVHFTKANILMGKDTVMENFIFLRKIFTKVLSKTTNVADLEYNTLKMEISTKEIGKIIFSKIMVHITIKMVKSIKANGYKESNTEKANSFILMVISTKEILRTIKSMAKASTPIKMAVYIKVILHGVKETVRVFSNLLCTDMKVYGKMT